MEAEKIAAIAAARAGLEKVAQKSREDMRKWWEANLKLGHRTLGKIFLGRRIKGEDEEDS